MNPYLARNFITYALKRNFKSSSSILLYDMAMVRDEKGRAMLEGAFQDHWEFHYEAEGDEDKPVGWSIKFGDKYHKLPSSLELQEGRIHYRRHLGALMDLASRFEEILFDIKLHRPDEGDESEPLGKDERDVLYLKTFL